MLILFLFMVLTTEIALKASKEISTKISVGQPSCRLFSCTYYRLQVTRTTGLRNNGVGFVSLTYIRMKEKRKLTTQLA